MNFVLDACAMIAFLRREDGADTVLSILRDSANTCVAHAVNVCEVYYDFVRAADIQTADAALHDIRAAGVRIRSDMNTAFWTGVARLKGTIRKVSLADCFAIELWRTVGGEIVTSDHHEFDALVANGVCRVRFIR
jgi:PIN domain nuclease of toxin-antitoxin system